jgi:hypothetical protein
MEDVLRSCFALHEASWAHNAPEALAALASEPHETVVVGLRASDVRHRGLARAIRSHPGFDSLRLVCVLGVSSLARGGERREVREALYALGADEVIEVALDEKGVSELPARLGSPAHRQAGMRA